MKPLKDRFVKSRWFLHLSSHVVFGLLGIISLKNFWISISIVFLTLIYSILYYGAYLLERIAITKNHSKDLFWLLGKFLSVIFNISISFSICYFILISIFPDSISNPEVLGKTMFEKGFNIFHFSLGNFLGMNSDIIIRGIPVKFLQIVQFFVSFSLLVFLFSNYHEIKENYSKYYTDEE